AGVCLGGAAVLASCGGPYTMTETMTFDQPITTEAECISTFEQSAPKWAGQPITASFVYQADGVEGDPEEFFFGAAGTPDDGYEKIINLEGGEVAIKEFLDTRSGKDTQLLITDDTLLLRKQPGRTSFGNILDEGCSLVGDGITLRQVSLARKEA
ncbi:MAG: hypothetical protein AAGK02_16310, partial [Pseudomonadota bacterium]